MKKVLIIAGFAMLTLASCKKDAPAPVVPPTPPPVQDPAPPRTPKPQAQTATPVTAPEEKDGTSISLDGNGISVKDKEGNNTKNITVSKTKKEVKIITD